MTRSEQAFELLKSRRLLAFLAPYWLMQTGLLLFMRAAWVMTPQLLRRTSPFELRRRIHS